MSFGEKLTEIMQQRNITPKEISDLSYKKLSVSLIQSIKKDRTAPTQRQISVLNSILGVDTEFCFEPLSDIGKSIGGIEINPNYNKFNKVVVQNKEISKKDNVPITPVDGSCVFHGCKKPATENCHYTGYEQSTFGKGLSKKVSNLFVADLCHDHHIYFDQPKERKSERMSSEFKTCILLSIKRKVDRGIIVFNKKVK